MFGQVFRCLSLHSVLATASWLHSDPRVLPVYLGNPFFVLVFYVIQHNRWDTTPCSFQSTFGCHERLANVWERRSSRNCWNVKIIREETFPGNKHGPHCTEERTNKCWGGYGAVKFLFTSEERNKVGGEPLGLHNNKSSSRGWGRRGWAINPESKTKPHSSGPWWHMNL